MIAAIAISTMAEEPAALRLASDEWPPFTGSPGSARAAIDLVETALERAGIASSTEIVKWKAVEIGIRRGEFDGSAAIWRNEVREKDLLFSAPYLENRLVLIGRSGSDVSATRMIDLAGKRVAAVGKYAYGDAVKNASGVLYVNSDNDQDSLDKLLAGEADYILVDELVARHLLTFQPEETEANLEIGLVPLSRQLLHFAIRHDVPNADRIISAFDSEIRKMLGDGSYAKILNVGWIRVDTNGDGLYELIPFGENIAALEPGTVYDVFGEMPENEDAQKKVIVIQGNIYEGWDAIPDRYKLPPTAAGGDTSFKYGTTVVTLKF
jgi:polar amino acid transport system substrate-binding protein